MATEHKDAKGAKEEGIERSTGAWVHFIVRGALISNFQANSIGKGTLRNLGWCTPCVLFVFMFCVLCRARPKGASRIISHTYYIYTHNIDYYYCSPSSRNNDAEHAACSSILVAEWTMQQLDGESTREKKLL